MFRTIVSISAVFAVSGEWDVFCENIDNRLPCSVADLTTEASVGVAFGSFIGSHTSESIKEFYSSQEGCPVFEEIYDASPSFRKFIDDYMTAHSLAFPTEHAEVIAMSQAAHVLSSSVFIQNACSELYLLFGYDIEVSTNPVPIMPSPIYAPYLVSDKQSETNYHDTVPSKDSSRKRHTNHCSDIGLIYSLFSNGEKSVIQGHNEDWWSGVADKMATVTTPEWWGYLYPGQLPGTSFVTTNSGLVLSMNSMYPSIPGYSSVSVPSGKGVAYLFSYVLRKAVSSKTTDEVIKTLSHYPIYSGYSLNVMSACDGSLTNIEGYGDRINVQSRHSHSSWGDSANQDGTIGHFNAYINSVVEQEAGGTSYARRNCELQTTFSTPEDVRAFLGDLDCPVFFTDLNGDHTSETMATWIADPQARERRMYRLPLSCEPSRSKCFNKAPTRSGDGALVFNWNFTCINSS